MVSMSVLAGLIFLMAFYSGIAGLIFFFKNNGEPKSWYILGKSAVIMYLGTMYGIVALDNWYDLIDYAAPASYTTAQALLRMAAFLTVMIFVTDTIIRKRT